MDSGLEEDFAAVTAEAVRRQFISAEEGRRLSELYVRHRWQKQMGDLFQSARFLAVIFAAVSAMAGMVWFAHSNIRETVWKRVFAAGNTVSRAIGFVWSYLVRAAEYAGEILDAAGSFWYQHVFQYVFEFFGALFSFLSLTVLWLWSVAAGAARLAFTTAAFVFSWVYGIAAVVFSWLYSAAASVFSWGYGIAAGVCSWLYSVAATVFSWVYAAAASALAWLYSGAAWLLQKAYGIAAAIFSVVWEALAAAAASVYGTVAAGAGWIAGAAGDFFSYCLDLWAYCWGWGFSAAAYILSPLLGWLGGGLAGIWDWICTAAANPWHTLTWWYWTSLASWWKVAALLAASLLADAASRQFAKKNRFKNYSRPAQAAGAALFSWMMGHIIELYAISHSWDGLEIVSLGMWAMLPVFVAVMTRVRPLLHGVLYFAVLMVHIAAYSAGVSGNVMVCFDVSAAVMIIAGADMLKERLGPHAPVLRYTAMGLLCFLLYCCGFIWDMPAVLEFRGSPSSDTLALSNLFILPAAGAAAFLAAWGYWKKGAARTRNDGLFTLLLLFTLFISWYPTGILLHSISVGEIYDLTRFGLSIFAGNVVTAALLAWAGWFLWCLWLLVESRDLNDGIMAQIAVTAMLGSLETRYIEVVSNISLVAGMMILPLMLVLVLAEVHIIRRWLRKLEGGDTLPAAEEEGGGQ